MMYSIGLSDNAFEVGDGSREPFAELYLRPPSAEQFACKPDVGTALSRVSEGNGRKTIREEEPVSSRIGRRVRGW